MKLPEGIYGGFHGFGVPSNGGFIMENPIKVDDLGVTLFQEGPISIHIIHTLFIDFVTNVFICDDMCFLDVHRVS